MIAVNFISVLVTLLHLVTLHPKSDIDRVYVSGHNGGRGLISVEMCARTKENYLFFYVNMLTERFTRGVKVTNIIDYEEPKEKNAFKREI